MWKNLVSVKVMLVKYDFCEERGVGLGIDLVEEHFFFLYTCWYMCVFVSCFMSTILYSNHFCCTFIEVGFPGVGQWLCVVLINKYTCDAVKHVPYQWQAECTYCFSCCYDPSPQTPSLSILNDSPAVFYFWAKWFHSQDVLGSDICLLVLPDEEVFSTPNGDAENVWTALVVECQEMFLFVMGILKFVTY